MRETSSSSSVYPKLQRIAELARRAPAMKITTLAHHIDVDWLREAYRRTRKSGAAGIDGQTAEHYAVDLEGNLERLLGRAKSGTYRAAPVRRTYIPKGQGGEKRPIGIPTFEDKVLQRAVVMAMEAVYEQDFYDCSYGFRPGRGAHDALRALRNHAMEMRGGWVLEVDIRKFFDTLDHGLLREIISQRVHDGVLLRLIGKWLKAGVLEAGNVRMSESGTPQGGVISPLLANIYLHEVLDGWFERDVRPRMRGRAHLVRYADDAVLLFEQEQDARRVLVVLEKRMARYGLALHPDKTRLVRFERPPRGGGRYRDGARPGTFNFLGFTHYWARSRRGNTVVLRKTARGSFTRALRAMRVWLRWNRHLPLAAQQHVLTSKLRGHYGYFGIVGNSREVWRFRHQVICAWRRWLSRRSQQPVTWAKMVRILERYPLAVPTQLRSV